MKIAFEGAGTASTEARPLAPDFEQLLADQQIVVVRGSAGVARTDLMDWDRFLETVISGRYPPKYLRVTRNNGMPVPSAFFHDKNGVKGDNLLRMLESGGSLIAYGIEGYTDTIGRFAADLGAALGERIEVGVIVTTGSGGALNIHFDKADAFIMQVEGRKRWTIYPDRTVSPYPGAVDKTPAPGADGPKALDTVLEPGDTLFMPAGHWHHCETVGGRSLHIALLFCPLSQARIIDLLYRDALQAGETRAALRDSSDRDGVIEGAKAALLEQLAALSPADLIARHLAKPMPSRAG